MSAPILAVANVEASYGPVKALRGISLSAALPALPPDQLPSRTRLAQAWPDSRGALREAADGLVGRALDGEATEAVVREVDTALGAWLAAG